MINHVPTNFKIPEKSITNFVNFVLINKKLLAPKRTKNA